MQSTDGGILGVKKPVGRKLPDSFVLHLDLDQTSIVDSVKSIGWESFLQKGRQSMTLRSVVKSLETATKDDRVQGFVATGEQSYTFHLSVVCLLGCDGIKGLGMIQELRSAVLKFTKNGKKRFKSVFYADSFGEAENKTLAYYLASAFHQIYMQPTGQLATVGFSIQTPFFKQFLDKYNIQPRVWNREAYKNALDMFTQSNYSPPHQEQMQWILDGIFDQVIEGISSGRGLDKASVNDAINASPMRPVEALRRGLIDSLCYKSDVMKLFTSNDQSIPRVSIKDYYQIKQHEEKKQKSGEKSQVLVMDAMGSIVQGWGGQSIPKRSTLCSGKFNQQLSAIASNPKIGAVVIRVDSNGGSAIASDSIRQQIAELKNAGKFVVVSMGNMAASGGYYLSLGANLIIANPGTLTGSIGVITGSPYVAEFLKDWGICVSTLKRGPNATLLSPFCELSQEQESILNEILDSIYQKFLTAVCEARRMDLATVQSLAQGRVWLGSDALNHGLVDALGGLSDAIALAKRGAGLPENAPVVESVGPYRYFEFIEGFLQQFGAIYPTSLDEFSAASTLVSDTMKKPTIQTYSYEAETIFRSIS